MRGILIDPFAKTITEVEVEKGIHAIYELIDATCFDVVGLNDAGDLVYVDDEGLYREDQAFFVWHGYETPLAGKGLILGCDCEGESRSPRIMVEEVRLRVSFPDLQYIGTEEVEWFIDHPVLGPHTPYFGNRPVFKAK